MKSLNRPFLPYCREFWTTCKQHTFPAFRSPIIVSLLKVRRYRCDIFKVPTASISNFFDFLVKRVNTIGKVIKINFDIFHIAWNDWWLFSISLDCINQILGFIGRYCFNELRPGLYLCSSAVIPWSEKKYSISKSIMVLSLYSLSYFGRVSLRYKRIIIISGTDSSQPNRFNT